MRSRKSSFLKNQGQSHILRCPQFKFDFFCARDSIVCHLYDEKKKLLRSFYKQNVPQVKGQKAHTYLCICIPERIEKSKGCIPNSYREELWIEE